MLCELRIRNFALIDELSVRLAPGLNVLTGETGAGKSIIVGALSLLLGERASADVVREGADRASVEGVFDVSDRPEILRLLEDRGFEPEDGLLIVRREVAAEGRSRAWLNGSPSTATLLGEVGRLLVDLHGQHEHQTLLRRDEQRAILDAYGDCVEAAAAVRAGFRRAEELRMRIADVQSRAREVAQRADFLRFQVDEIDGARLTPGEEERLDESARRLAHAEELISLAGSLAEAITGDDGVGTRLGALRRSLEQLTRIDPSQADANELYDTAYYALEELGGRFAEYAGTIEHDPARLAEVRRRQDLLYRLCSKYGRSAEEVIAHGDRARAELAMLDGSSLEVLDLQKQAAAVTEELERLASALSATRTAAAGRLEAEVLSVLPALGMAGGRFEVVLLPLSEIGAGGREEVEYRVSVNRGFEPKPLAQVASGGELSRVMLAIKTILARVDAVPTLIFDEVDAGIGGKVALQVGEKMREVAGSHQVFAITHLPQIASRAHAHLAVSKHELEDRAATRVRELTGEERVREVARMLGGDPESQASLEHARELLERGAGLARSA